jgi:NAD(P)-dependent dehydrogenase (short-subunit alcohol dehydrogenase family)
MANTKVTNGLAVTIVIAALVWLYVFFNPRPPPIDRALHEKVGEVMAAEATKLLEPGAKLIVVARATDPFEVPAAAAQLDALLSALEKSGKNVSTKRLLKVDPLRVTSVPPGDFLELMRQASANDVIVSFLGPPLLSDDQLIKLGTKRPRIVALCSGAMPLQVDLRKVFERQLLATAVISRTNAPAKPAAGSPQQGFDQMFQVITLANVSELPPLTHTAH